MGPLLKLCAAAGAFLSLPACKTVPSRQEVPALIVEPTTRSREELAQAVSTALNGVPVRLADDALTHESVLVIERARHRDPSGLPANGRDLGRPEHFRLVKDGAECVLIHEESGKRFTLATTACSPI